MKKLAAICLALMLLMVAVSTEYSLSAVETTPLTDSQLDTLNGTGFWGCAITAGASILLVVAAGVATGGLGAIAGGALGVSATRAACTD